MLTMKRILNAYYELTIIPAIVLGCLTSLLHYVMTYFQTGMPYTSVGDTLIAFIFFLIVMTAENVWDRFMNVAGGVYHSTI